MQVLCLVWGILALVGMFVAFIPCLGALNWVNIPFAIVGLIVSIVVVATSKAVSKSSAVAGLVCNAAAVIFGIVRLSLGGGIV
jgi:hypothetical protein